MNFHEALKALQAGLSIKRPGYTEQIFTLQKSVVPVLVDDDRMGYPLAHWRTQRFVVNEINAPVAFDAEQMAATDWASFP